MATHPSLIFLFSTFELLTELNSADNVSFLALGQNRRLIKGMKNPLSHSEAE